MLKLTFDGGGDPRVGGREETAGGGSTGKPIPTSQPLQLVIIIINNHN